MKVKIIKSCFGGVEFLAQPKVLVLGGVGSAGVERLEFTLPREWAGMAVTLHIWMLLAVDGKGYTAMTRPAEYRCSPSIDLNPTLEDIPKSVYEQFIARVLKDAAAAQAAAASAEQDAKAAQEAAALSQKAALEAAEQAGKAGEGLTNRERWWLLELLRRAAYTDPASKNILAKLGEAWETVRVEQIVLNQNYQALEAGADFTLTAEVLPDDAADKTVSWTTGNSDVVALTPGGTDNQTCTVRAMGEGIAMIAAKAGTKQAVCAVYVKAAVVAAESIRLDKTSAAVTEGGTLTLTATVLPDNATDRTVSWAVSPADVAEISTNGTVCTVNIKAAGSAVVTASAQGCTASCTITATEKPVEVVSVTLRSETLDLTEEDTARLTATVLPENATDRTVSWAVSPADVAEISTNGTVCTVNIKAAGSAVVTASAQGCTASCTITATEKPVEVVSVTLRSETLDLTEEDTARLTATVLPENATDRTVTWTSSNPNTATVADGVVTAVGEGTARITAQAGNKTASCTVNVAAKKVYYSIAYRLTHVNTSSTLVVVEKGKSYATALTAESGYKLGSASCTMGGAGIEVNDGVVEIASVTGNIILTASADAIRVTSVSLNRTSLNLTVGGSAALTAAVKPDDALNKAVTWSSSSSAVSVSDGVVKAVSTGNAVVRATADGVSADCAVSVAKKTKITWLRALAYNTATKTCYSSGTIGMDFKENVMILYEPHISTSYADEIEVWWTNGEKFNLKVGKKDSTVYDGGMHVGVYYEISGSYSVGDSFTVTARAGSLTSSVTFTVRQSYSE